jgi:hypothetical protein
LIVTFIGSKLMIRDTHYRQVQKNEGSLSLIPHAEWKNVVFVIKGFSLPCQPSDEASGISANDEFSNLVQTDLQTMVFKGRYVWNACYLTLDEPSEKSEFDATGHEV